MNSQRINALFLTILGAVLFFVVWFIDAGKLPERWSASQSVPGEYEIRLDKDVFRTGKASVCIRSKTDNPKGFANFYQEFMAIKYRGRRVHMEAYVKTSISAGTAHLWLETYGPEGKRLSLDDMPERRMTGTTGWTKYDLVLDVPKEAQKIAFGFIFSGKGQAWIDDFSFQSVVGNIPVAAPDSLEGPVNLGFE
ncbi:MAG TPA: hypothetical protein VK463_15530 [Desulfomonilaceae bacterium]|nr:hypothetical protein [Desulfomonilaceae bacterium]